ncbi:MAG: TetR/AcrR family transcriptional regulator [Jatrophihabitans sp.]|uniref:TetR/AcrR family transcriptional regulator n=1 Tax=Jatrophihabitans sp. TaxID=1932789 RepID=UPI00390E1F03
MAVDASGTRAKLIAAGERLFAVNGIHGAQMRDIVRAAGQANDSAVHYHFGSRDGLLSAICQWHIDAMEPARVRRLAAQESQPDLATVIADMVQPTADRLQTQEGRYFLRITAQLAGHAGVRSGSVPPPIVSRALRAQLEQVHRICAESMPAELAGERIAVMIGALTAALADRAVRIEEGGPFVLDESAFVANLNAMLVAALLAPVPALRS